MAFILDEQREADCEGAFNRYWKYLAEHRQDFPVSVYEIASSRWWYSFEDREAPHDATLREARFSETADLDYNVEATFTILLDSPWDGDNSIFKIEYRGLVGYNFDVPLDCFPNGHSDWRYDEFRVEANGVATHEIEWGHGAIWVLHFREMAYTVIKNQSEPVTRPNP